MVYEILLAFLVVPEALVAMGEVAVAGVAEVRVVAVAAEREAR